MNQGMGRGNILHIRDYGDNNEGEEFGEDDADEEGSGPVGLEMEDEDWNRQQEEDNGE